MFKLSNKDTRPRSQSFCYLRTYFILFSSISIIILNKNMSTAMLQKADEGSGLQVQYRICTAPVNSITGVLTENQ